MSAGRLATVTLMALASTGLALGAGACNQGSPDAAVRVDGGAYGGPPIWEIPRGWFEPGDVATNIGVAPLRFDIDNVPPFYPQDQQKLASQAIMDELAAAIHLWTFPELDPVAMTTSVVIVPIESQCSYDAQPSCDLTHVLVTPDAPLSDRWYILSLDHAPILRDGSAMQIGAATPPDIPTGAFGVRFDVGSDPILVTTGTCEKALGYRAVYLDITENVQLGATAAGTPGAALEDSVVVTALPSGQRCGPIPDTSLPPGDPAMPRAELAYECAIDPAFDGVSIQLEPGLESATGKPLRLFDGRTAATIQVTTSDTDKLLPQGNPPSAHCYDWRLY